MNDLDEKKANSIHLHIGLEKTGTSSVQEFLSSNRHQLSRMGYFVPTCFRSSNHYELAILGLKSNSESNLLKWADLKNSELEEFSKSILESLRSDLNPEHKCLVSSEFLTSQVDGQIGPMMVVDKLKSEFECIEATLFVRRPEQLLVSRYTTAILAGRTNKFSIDNVAKQQMARQLLFENVTESWQNALDFSKLSIRAFPEKNTGISVIERYLDSIGVNIQEVSFDNLNLVSNTRLSKKALELIRKFNQEHEKFTLIERNQFIAQVRSLTSKLPEMSVSPIEFERLSKSFHETVVAYSEKLNEEEALEFLEFQPIFDDPVSWGEIDEDEIEEDFASICKKMNFKAVKKELHFDNTQKKSDTSLALISSLSKQAFEIKQKESYSDRYFHVIKKLSSEVRENGETYGTLEFNQVVPNNIFQYWEPWPPDEEIESYMNSWEDHGSKEFNYQAFTFDSAKDLLSEVLGNLGAQAFDLAWEPAMRADLFRYAVLHKFGGWYVDAEHESVFPPSHYLMDYQGCVFLERKQRKIFVNNFLGSIKNSKIMLDALKISCKNILNSTDTNVWKITGPGMLTQLLTKAKVDDGAGDIVEKFNIFPAKSFFGETQIIHNSAQYKAVHHWSARVRENRKGRGIKES